MRFGHVGEKGVAFPAVKRVLSSPKTRQHIFKKRMPTPGRPARKNADLFSSPHLLSNCRNHRVPCCILPSSARSTRLRFFETFRMIQSLHLRLTKGTEPTLIDGMFAVALDFHRPPLTGLHHRPTPRGTAPTRRGIVNSNPRYFVDRLMNVGYSLLNRPSHARCRSCHSCKAEEAHKISPMNGKAAC